MRRQRTAKTGKAIRMKFSRIISGCPEGAGKWHIQIIAMFYIAITLWTFQSAAWLYAKRGAILR